MQPSDLPFNPFNAPKLRRLIYFSKVGNLARSINSQQAKKKPSRANVKRRDSFSSFFATPGLENLNQLKR